jgi:hypothetical protein
MKVLDLHCQLGHVFEGWFASEDDFQNQHQRGLVECPMCGSHDITKRLSAPRLNLGAKPPAAVTPAASSGAVVSAGAVAPAQAPLQSVAHAPQEHAALQAAWLQMARKIMAHTEDVGDEFANEARRMHHGEVPERGIRGQATPDEAMALLDEGIAVVPLPLPEAAKETLQ